MKVVSGEEVEGTLRTVSGEEVFGGEGAKAEQAVMRIQERIASR